MSYRTSRAGDHSQEVAVGLRQADQVGDDAAQGGDVLVRDHQRALGSSVLQDPGANRVPFGVIAVQEPVWRPAVNLAGELPAEVEGVLDAQVEALAAGGQVDVSGVAGQQHPADPIMLHLA
jgi:hypothetical protein